MTPSPATSKGDRTRAAILDAAFREASAAGLEALSIGGLAGSVGLSKSGLFAHFRSKEALQVQVLEYARDDFVREVVAPAFSAARGRPRIEELFERWLDWDGASDRPGGCVFLQAAAEYDDRPGVVRDSLVSIQRDWVEALERAASIAKDEGHFRLDLDTAQFAFELYAIMMAYNFHTRLLEEERAEAWARTAFGTLLTAAC